MSENKLPFSKSTIIQNARFDVYRQHKGDGDMWPLTWAADGNMYGAAGDNQDSPMNFWRIEGHPEEREWGPPPYLFLMDNMPLDPKVYCTLPEVHPKWGIKPASLLSVSGTLYFAVELMNFGDCPDFNRQHNICSWIMTSDNLGKTWDKTATPQDFFTGRLASPHFIQFGKDYADAPDNYIYACFPCAEDGQSYWENGDYILLGRVDKELILSRSDWRFYANGEWVAEDSAAVPVFSYPRMTGENHVSYNKYIGRYIMGNYGFTDKNGQPFPYHQTPLWDPERQFSQLTLFEAENPWGPWSLFYRDDNWGVSGGYNPSFPTKWMNENSMYMVYSGSMEDYNFTLQKLTFEIAR